MPDATLNTTANGWPYLDDQNYIDITDDYSLTLANKLETDVTQLSQDAAAAAAAANALAGTFLVGPGRPDIPATTPYTATELNAMPVGMRYRSTDGPQGAWEWRKTGATTWVVTDGTTGTRNVNALFVNGWQDGTGSNGRILRAGDQVEMYTVLRGVTATADVFFTLPVGFRDNGTNAGTPAAGTTTSLANPVTPQYNTGTLRTVARPSLGWWRHTWTTTDPWPTTLPGTAA